MVEGASGIIVFYRCCHEGTLDSLLLEILVDMMVEPCKRYLRNELYLGYDASCGIRDTLGGNRALAVWVQNSHEEVDTLDKMIEQFLGLYGVHIDILLEEDFNVHKNNVLRKRTSLIDLTPSEKNQNYWKKIISAKNGEDVHFDRNVIARMDALTKSLARLTTRDLVEFYNTFLRPNSATRDKQAIHYLKPSESNS